MPSGIRGLGWNTPMCEGKIITEFLEILTLIITNGVTPYLSVIYEIY